MSDEVTLAQQQVSPHGLQVLQQQVVTVENVQQVFAGVKVGGVDLPLKRPLQVRQQLCSWGGDIDRDLTLPLGTDGLFRSAAGCTFEDVFCNATRRRHRLKISSMGPTGQRGARRVLQQMQ